MIIRRMKRSDVPTRVNGRAWVYILTMGEPVAACKIGIAVDLYARLSKLASHLRDREYPIGLHCAYLVPYARNKSPTQSIEAQAQNMLQGWRFVGASDWFVVSADRAAQVVYDTIFKRVGASYLESRFPKAAR